MKNFIKIAIFSLMVFLLASCACNRTNTEPSAPLTFELQEDVTITSVDSTQTFTLNKGCVVYVYEDDCVSKDSVDNFLNYHLLANTDMLDDNENYRAVIVRMGKINDSTQVVGYMNMGVLTKHKRLR